MDSVRLDSLKASAEDRKRISNRIKELQPKVSNRRIADTLGVNRSTVDRDTGAKAPPRGKNTKAIKASANASGANAPYEVSGAGAAKIVERRLTNINDVKERRAERERELGDKIIALPDKQYGVILMDWPRKTSAWSEDTGHNRSPDKHYATQTFRWAVDVLAPMIQKLAAPDCMLLTWTTAASLIDDIEIMTEAGFCALRPRGPDGRLLRAADGEPLAAVSPGGGTYRCHQVWDKELRGTGHWFIDRHELVLLGVRGKIPCPASGTASLSLFSERRSNVHSAKPEFVAAEVDRIWPNLPKIELFRRGPPRPGWDAWGAETVQEAPDNGNESPSLAIPSDDGLDIPPFLDRRRPA
jgi:N6-adenosine-specific RNA methylase IME4